MNDVHPPLGQLLGAGFVAAFAAVTPFAAFVASAAPDQAVPLIAAAYLFGLPLALLHVYLLGLPAYHLLRVKWALTWRRSALGGLMVGGLPSALLSAFVTDFHPDAPGAACFPGALGALGGLAFRAWIGAPAPDRRFAGEAANGRFEKSVSDSELWAMKKSVSDTEL